MSVFLPVPSIDQAMAILIPQHASHATPAIQSSNWYSHKCYVFQSMHVYVHDTCTYTRYVYIYVYTYTYTYIYNTTVAYKYMYVSIQQGTEGRN